jgi:glyoxylase-like metal-dependent hydrolase (beta-lactamase superfamily II)
MVAPDDSSLRVSIEPLTDWLYCLASPVVNAYAIRQSTSFVLVDTGVVGAERGYLRALEQIGGVERGEAPLGEIFLTHGHEDHTGSAAALVSLTGATVRGPAVDADVIQGRAARADPILLDWEVPLFERYGKVAPAPPMSLDAVVEDEDWLNWDRPAQVIAAPGHTAGSVAVFFPEDCVLIAGDAIMSIDGEPRLGAFNVDPDQARSSVRRLARLGPKLLCVGHGSPITQDTRSRLTRLAETL